MSKSSILKTKYMEVTKKKCSVHAMDNWDKYSDILSFSQGTSIIGTLSLGYALLNTTNPV